MVGFATCLRFVWLGLLESLHATWLSILLFVYRATHASCLGPEKVIWGAMMAAGVSSDFSSVSASMKHSAAGHSFSLSAGLPLSEEDCAKLTRYFACAPNPSISGIKVLIGDFQSLTWIVKTHKVILRVHIEGSQVRRYVLSTLDITTEDWYTPPFGRLRWIHQV